VKAYYNEIDPYAAQWLRNLVAAGHIAPGDVDERSIVDVQPDDLRGYTQCHFFAGIGGWSYALRLAGWPDDRPAWTGSCPCQPFSAAGKQRGSEDERHLWPAFFRLISECRPLASRLPALLDSRGSTMFALTWKMQVTPLRRLVCRLLESGRRIDGIDSTGLPRLPTPSATDYKGAGRKRLERGTNLNSRDWWLINYGFRRPPADMQRWTMGYPDSWAKSAPTAMPSSRKSQKHS
jgi:hypothetical protein